jgi:NAD(P)-dependent dehydrogenase (short-subunit alcohol dehydrogenase family)
MPLKNKKVVVIGGSSGIGFAVARAAAAEGAAVVIASRSQDKVDLALEAAGSAAIEGRVLDVTREAAVREFFGALGPFDHLVTTAVIWMPKTRLAEQSTEDFRTIFEVKFWGQYHAARHAAPFLRPGGSITLSSGQLSHRPTVESVPRSSVNGAVETMGRALAVELAPLRVNTVCAGVVATERWQHIEKEKREAEFARIGEKLLVGHIAAAEDIAQSYLYLMSNRFTTGTVLLVEGGALLV